MLVEKVIEANTRTMEAMASAFGTVRPSQPAPMTVEQPAPAVAPESGGMKPEQVIQMAMQAIPMIAAAWKTGLANAGVGGVTP